LSLDISWKNTTILSRSQHEISDLWRCTRRTQESLRLPGLQSNEDFRALGTLIEGLGKLSAMELRLQRTSIWMSSKCQRPGRIARSAERLTAGGNRSDLRLHDDLPLITAHAMAGAGLSEPFAKQSRAMETTDKKQLTISSAVDANSVVIRSRTPGGNSFPDGSLSHFTRVRYGLGLYVSPPFCAAWRRVGI